jgi:hypothetical protein
MDPEAMKPVRPRGCPRDRSDPTARVAHTPKSIFSPSFPERNYRPQARVARTMKLLPSFRLPDAPAPTSLHGAPAGELPLHPVSRTSKPRAIRGTRTAEPPRHPVSRAVKQPQLHGSPMFWSQRRRRGCPKHRHSPHPTGCSSCGTFVRRAVARTTTFGPTALIRSEADLFIRLPARRSRPHCTDAHAGGTRFSQFPARSVPPPHSHLRGERVAVRRSHRIVAHAMSMSRTASSVSRSPAESARRARGGIISRLPVR